ncbi:MAG TPA: hypothetical protein VF624_13690, partial [Tepidisphaeraceae bacterium]
DNPDAPAGQPVTEQKHPISYVRSKPGAASTVSASPTLLYTGVVGNWQMKGEGRGLTFTAAGVQSGGGYAWASVTSNALPETIDSKDLEINWKMSIDGGNSWFEVGTSKNHLYLTGGAANGAYETVLHLSSEGAKGKRPANDGEMVRPAEDKNGNGVLDAGEDLNNNGVQDAASAGWTSNKEVVDGIWGQISGGNGPKNPKSVDGSTLYYWGAAAISRANTPFGLVTVADVMKHKDGQCGGWGRLLVDLFAKQGISSSARGITPTSASADYKAPVAGMDDIDRTKFTATALGFTVGANLGQGGTNTERNFQDHLVVSVTGIDSVFDPSYGKRFEPDFSTGKSAEQKWEDASIVSFRYRYQWTGAGANNTPYASDFTRNETNIANDPMRVNFS